MFYTWDQVIKNKSDFVLYIFYHSTYMREHIRTLKENINMKRVLPKET